MDAIGIFAKVSPELHAALEEAVTTRGITKRQLIEAALRTELAHPTVMGEPDNQGALYDEVA